MKIINIMMLSVGIVFSSSALSRTVCTATTANKFYVEAERPSDIKYSNILLIKFDDSCAGKGYAYIENTAGAYAGILSTTLMAFSMSKKLIIAVDEKTVIGNASRIEYLHPE